MENSQKISRSNFSKIYKIACPDWKQKFDKVLGDQKFETDINISDKFAKEMFQESNSDQEKILLKFLKKPENKNLKVTSYEAALKLNNEKCTIQKTDTLDEIAYKKLKAITKALNGGKIVERKDILNGNYVYTVFFYLNSAGVGCVHASDHVSVASAHYGFRLCFFESDTRDYAMNKFKDLYEQFYTS